VHFQAPAQIKSLNRASTKRSELVGVHDNPEASFFVGALPSCIHHLMSIEFQRHLTEIGWTPINLPPMTAGEAIAETSACGNIVDRPTVLWITRTFNEENMG